MRDHTDQVESLFRELAAKSKGAEPPDGGWFCVSANPGLGVLFVDHVELYRDKPGPKTSVAIVDVPAAEGLIRGGYGDLARRLERCGVELEARGGDG